MVGCRPDVIDRRWGAHGPSGPSKQDRKLDRILDRAAILEAQGLSEFVVDVDLHQAGHGSSGARTFRTTVQDALVRGGYAVVRVEVADWQYSATLTVRTTVVARPVAAPAPTAPAPAAPAPAAPRAPGTVALTVGSDERPMAGMDARAPRRGAPVGLAHAVDTPPGAPRPTSDGATKTRALCGADVHSWDRPYAVSMASWGYPEVKFDPTLTMLACLECVSGADALGPPGA